MKSAIASLRPANWLMLALLYNLLAMALAIGLSLRTPWLGLQLQPDANGQIRVLSAEGVAHDLPAGAVLLDLAAHPSGPVLELRPEDLLEEPDVVADYVQMDAFFARQGQIAAVLAQPQVRIGWQAGKEGDRRETVVRPVARPLHSLPLLFWFQLAVSMCGCMIAVWVWVLRPSDWGVRMFGVTGLLFPVFAMSAAVYSGRELALDAHTFFVLSAVNHWGAYMFGAALIGIFVCHPRPLMSPRRLWLLFVGFSLWWLADVARLAPDLDWGNRFLVMTEMALAMLLAGVQWRRSKGQPVDRASLRWLFLSLLLGSGLFILSIIVTVSLGWLPPIAQGYAFGFFLLIYIGIAMGLRRYRLFDLEDWAFRMLSWVGGALAVVGLDALLVLALDWSAGPALGVSLWICGVLYFPFRQWVWRRLVQRPRLQLHQVMPDVVQIAFQSSQSDRELVWQQLLHRLYAPLELTRADAGAQVETALAEDGLALHLPACGGVAAHWLRYPDQGQRLFSGADVTFMAAVCRLMDQAQGVRAAQEQGAAEERKRIARDMHDDVGARLLMLIHRAPSPELAELARAAMNDLRTALGTLDAQPVLLKEALADWRAEVGSRCEAAGVALQWRGPAQDPVGYLPARHKSLLERALREGVTNALKHAMPHNIRVQFEQDAPALTLSVSNDGTTPALDTWREGRGLRGMRHRLSEVGAELDIDPGHDGWTSVRIRLPQATEVSV